MAELAIVRDPEAQRALAARPGRSASSIVIASPDEPWIPWAGLRRLYAELCARAPRSKQLRVPDPLRLVFRGAEATPRHVLSLGAQAPGFLSHHPILAWPLTQAWVNALAPLVSGLEIAFLYASTLDPMEVAVLRRVARSATRLTLTLGDEPIPESQSSKVRPHHPLDDQLEAQAYESLATDAPDVDLVLDAMEVAWSCFGFGACRWLGLEALRLHLPMAPDDRRRTHALVALSTFNREVERRGEGREPDADLAQLLDEHYHAALDGETDLRERAHLCYRLAVNAGQRPEGRVAAVELAEEAIQLAAETGDPLFEAWALGGRGMLAVAEGDVVRARRWVGRAFELAAMPVRGPSATELPLTQVVLADHLAAIECFAGDAATALSWQARAESLGNAIGVPYVPSFRWISLYRAQANLASAVAVAERGLAAARELVAPADEEQFALALGDLYYRRGQPKLARRYFMRAQAVSDRWSLGEVAPAARAGAALAALRANRFDDARHDLERLLVDAATVAERAELLALLGVLAARAGQSVVSELRLNEAIELALEDGHRDVLLRVANAAGEACLSLGRPDDARRAFAHALGLGELGESASAADRFASIAGLLSAGGGADYLLAALELLEPALVEAETWWHLVRITDAARRFGKEIDNEVLFNALSQRCDADESQSGRPPPP